MNLPNLRKAALALPLLLLGAQPASAANLSGTFAHDNDVQFFTFDLASPAIVTLQTDSFGNGGFTPWLQLWDATGSFVQAGSNLGSGSGDASISENLAAGTYYGALFVSYNYFAGPGGLDFPGAPAASFASVYDPTLFRYSGSPDIAPQFLLDFQYGQCQGDAGLTGNYFVYDLGGCANRGGNWSLNVTAGTPSALVGVGPYPASTGVPEPGTLALALAGLGGFAPARRRRAQAPAL